MNPSQNYELIDPYNGESQILSGAALAAGELSFTLGKNAAGVRHLKEVH